MVDVASLVVRISANTSNLQTAIGTTKRDLTRMQTDVQGSFGKAANSLRDFGRDAGLSFLPAVSGAAVLALGLKTAIGAAISFESEFANVIKTVDATDEEIAQLRRGLRELATGDSPVAALENSLTNLTQVAAAAGQLGIKTENILEFSEIMTALGVATDYTAEEAAIMAARFANITGMDPSKYRNFGDVLVTLGNNVAATESEIGAFALRTATLSNYGWETDAILGYSAALAGLGVSAELGGTNMNKSVADMTTAVALGGEKLRVYARIARMTTVEFKDLAKATPTQAFTAFIEGLSKMNADEQILQLRELGITSVEQITTLQRLAGGYDTLTDALGLAAEGWAGNNAAMDEAAKKADTTQGSLNRLGNSVNELFTSLGEAVMPVFDVAVNVAAQGIQAGADLLNQAGEMGRHLGQIVSESIVIDFSAPEGGPKVVGEQGAFAAAVETWIADNLIVVGMPLEVAFDQILIGADAVDTISQTVNAVVSGMKPVEMLVGAAVSLLPPDTQALVTTANTFIAGLVENGGLSPTQTAAIQTSAAVSLVVAAVETTAEELGASISGFITDAVRVLTPIAILPNDVMVMTTGVDWIDAMLGVSAEGINNATQQAELAAALRVEAGVEIAPLVINRDGIHSEVTLQTTDALTTTPVYVAAPALADMMVAATLANPETVDAEVTSALSALNFDTAVPATITVTPTVTWVGAMDAFNAAIATATAHALAGGGKTGTAGELKPDGSHAAGLDYVPYDGYIAELHRGERVLTAAQARDHSGGGVTVNVTGGVFANGPQEFAEFVKRVLAESGY